MKHLFIGILSQASSMLHDLGFKIGLENIADTISNICTKYEELKTEIGKDRLLSESGKNLQIAKARDEAIRAIDSIKDDMEGQRKLEQMYINQPAEKLTNAEAIIRFLQEQEVRAILRENKTDSLTMQIRLEQALIDCDDAFINSVAHTPQFMTTSTERKYVADILKKAAMAKMPEDIRKTYEDRCNMNAWVAGLKNIGKAYVDVDFARRAREAVDIQVDQVLQ